MSDGSRHFAEVPWRPALALKQQLLDTPGVTVTAFVPSVSETWIDFEFAGHRFSAHNPWNTFCLFVRDPTCPDSVLREVRDRLAQVNGVEGEPPQQTGRIRRRLLKIFRLLTLALGVVVVWPLSFFYYPVVGREAYSGIGTELIATAARWSSFAGTTTPATRPSRNSRSTCRMRRPAWAVASGPSSARMTHPP